jgi:hypothetical protein
MEKGSEEGKPLFTIDWRDKMNAVAVDRRTFASKRGEGTVVVVWCRSDRLVETRIRMAMRTAIDRVGKLYELTVFSARHMRDGEKVCEPDELYRDREDRQRCGEPPHPFLYTNRLGASRDRHSTGSRILHQSPLSIT